MEISEVDGWNKENKSVSVFVTVITEPALTLYRLSTCAIPQRDG